MNTFQIKITENEANQRLDKFLRKFFKNYPEIHLNDIYSWIRKGLVKVNWIKQKENYRLKYGDIINFDENIENIIKKPSEIITSKENKKIKINLNDIKKQILYEDDNRIFWNKPAGIVVHPWNKHENDITLNDYLEIYTKNNTKSPTFKPAFCFRLDKDTSWIIIAAKTFEALKYLNQLIKDRKTDKYYLAIVLWKFPKHIIIDYPLFRWFNKRFWRAQMFVNYEKWVYAKTEAWNIKTIKDLYLGKISLVKIKLYTWRMHQIRVHLSTEWYPILWDIMYWNKKINKLLYQKYKINRQLLHSWKYWFYDKFKNKYIQVEAPLPNDFKQLLFNNQKINN
jgi:23S rRNA pseudouridine955/2504/2580 synthase